ncbi:MAG: histidine--tRNA ligase [Bacteroidota bacterium]
MEPRSASPVRGTRDFGASQMRRRKALFSLIEAAFLRCGYGPLETPAMEQWSTLHGKYGEEGDRLIFNVLNSGAFTEAVPSEDWNQLRENPRALLPLLCEKALRYDLTIPLARYVAANHSKLSFPFKRYQIQPVWRADRPQKGRFREFIQCDADIVASEITTFHQAELLGLYREVLDQLGFKNYQIRVNDRRFLNLLAVWGRVPGQVARLGMLLVKVDKQGWDLVQEEILALGFDRDRLQLFRNLVSLGKPSESGMTWKDFQGWWAQVLGEVASDEPAALEAQSALSSTEEVLRFFDQQQGLRSAVLRFDPCLARGIDYYTGLVVEVVAPELGLGSLGGGGLYSGLTAMFGYPEWKGMGISFGAERLLEGMERLGLWDQNNLRGLDLICYASDSTMEREAQSWVLAWRAQGLAADWFPMSGKYKKATEHALRSEAAWLVVFGEREWSQKEVTLQSPFHQERHRLAVSDVANFLSQ